MSRGFSAEARAVVDNPAPPRRWLIVEADHRFRRAAQAGQNEAFAGVQFFAGYPQSWRTPGACVPRAGLIAEVGMEEEN